MSEIPTAKQLEEAVSVLKLYLAATLNTEDVAFTTYVKSNFIELFKSTLEERVKSLLVKVQEEPYKTMFDADGNLIIGDALKLIMEDKPDAFIECLKVMQRKELADALQRTILNSVASAYITSTSNRYMPNQIDQGIQMLINQNAFQFGTVISTIASGENVFDSNNLQIIPKPQETRYDGFAQARAQLRKDLEGELKNVKDLHVDKVTQEVNALTKKATENLNGKFDSFSYDRNGLYDKIDAIMNRLDVLESKIKE
jgi:hypothetical protein